MLARNYTLITFPLNNKNIGLNIYYQPDICKNLLICKLMCLSLFVNCKLKRLRIFFKLQTKYSH